MTTDVMTTDQVEYLCDVEGDGDLDGFLDVWRGSGVAVVAVHELVQQARLQVHLVWKTSKSRVIIMINLQAFITNDNSMSAFWENERERIPPHKWSLHFWRHCHWWQRESHNIDTYAARYPPPPQIWCWLWQRQQRTFGEGDVLNITTHVLFNRRLTAKKNRLRLPKYSIKTSVHVLVFYLFFLWNKKMLVLVLWPQRYKRNTTFSQICICVSGCSGKFSGSTTSEVSTKMECEIL